MPISQSIGTKRLASLSYDLPDSQSKYMKRAYSQKQARAISAKINKRFPYADYGRAYFKRREPGSVQYNTFGATYKTADAQQRRNRKLAGYYGDGLYTGRGRYNFFKSIGRGFKKIGRALKPVAKEALNAGIHAGVGALMGGGLYTGRGGYVSNTLIEGSGDPAMQVTGSGDETESVMITHKEYIGDIYGPSSTAFNSQSYELNPGLASQFPWLSQIAVNYDEYRWEQLVFEYRATIDSSTVTNGQTGTIIMATQYNLDSKVFESKDEMMQYHGAMSARLTDDMSHGVECDPNKNKGTPIRLVRNGPLDPQTQDLDEYDIGRFELAINNCPNTFANQAVGELWVYYTVRLLKPKLASQRGASTQWATFGCTSGINVGDIYGINSKTTLTTLGNLGVSLARLNHASSPVDAAGYTSITFPANFSGTVRITMRIEGTGLSGNIYNSASVTGNVQQLFNQYCAGNDTGENPRTFFLCRQAETQVVIMELRVRTATGGIDNMISVQDTVTGTTFTQSYIEIVELPNISRSSSNVLPKYFNSNGNRSEMS